MARFVFTMNLPAQSGRQSQEVVAEHSAGDVEDLFSKICGAEWVIVEQLYQYNRQWKPRGKVMLNVAYIGKVKQFVENESTND